MLNQFLDFIAENQLFLPNQRILLAVSGGVDSMVMLDLFAQSPFQFAVAHCNFGLRGADADGDEAFVKQTTEKHKVLYFSKLFDTKEYAESQGISTQMAARDLRYAWFNELLTKEKFDFLATAHHQNDNLETILLNLLRGTGIAGLRGILPKQGKIVRPLLAATRQEIREYATQTQMQWREDYSNWENKYRRNQLRNEIIPTLKKINPNLDYSIQQTAERMRAIENIFKKQVEKTREKVINSSESVIYIQIEPLKKITEGLIQLAEILKTYGFHYQQTKEIWASLDKESGKVFESANYQLVKDRHQLVITAQNRPHTENSVWHIAPDQTELSTDFFRLKINQLLDLQGFTIPKQAEVACLDGEKLVFPLQVRAWQAGDYFYPLGMNQRKKISDFLIDLKIPLNLKKQVFVLTSQDDIVWVIGYRIDNRFKFTEKTHKVLIINKL
ncbi:MAG: tRNA lysidine(34) synthetase TilS [Microscillaceae bacterium]|jgi:tRNA(Ile)-lysidine synthase|nr:tRNA lysidine(34) synthetase TilS [Microscillaceae bacterium]